jgi:hypothetical protein
MSIKCVGKAANLNVCGGRKTKQGELDFVFLQLADELFVSHVVVLREDCAEELGRIERKTSLSRSPHVEHSHENRNLCTCQHERPKL